MADRISLRNLAEGDLPIIFEHQLDPVAWHMAAFTPKDPSDREGFLARWRKILQNGAINKKAIVLDGEVIGMIARFKRLGDAEVTFWLGRDYWNRGLATDALRLFVKRLTARPLYARAAKDNIASIRVLQKCGFKQVGEERGFANARDAEIDELILRLD